MIQVVITSTNTLMFPAMEQKVRTVLKRVLTERLADHIQVEIRNEKPTVQSAITVQIDLTDVNWGDVDKKWAWSFIRRSTVKKFKAYGGARVTQV